LRRKFIDGVSQGVQTVRTAQPGYVQQSVIYSNINLTSGEHTIKVVYQDGADGADYMVVDAFKVYR